MNTLYLLKYNNYYDRLVKKEESLQDYLSKDTTYVQITNYDFVPGDGVSKNEILDIDASLGKNYVLVCNESTIVSRWFIMEQVRTRDGRYNVTLQRDAIVDEYNHLIQSPVFIEKATVLESDPFIYNMENITTNQIKTNEWLLMDETRVPWLVAYISRKTAVTETYTEKVTEGSSSTEKVYTKLSGAEPIKIDVPKNSSSAYDYTNTQIPMSPAFSSSDPEAIRYTSYESSPAFQFTGNPCYAVFHNLSSGQQCCDFITFNDENLIMKVVRYKLTTELFKTFWKNDSSFSKTITFNTPEEQEDYVLKFKTNQFNGRVKPGFYLNNTLLLGVAFYEQVLPVGPYYNGKICHDLVSDENFYINNKTHNISENVLSVGPNIFHFANSGITGADAITFFDNNLKDKIIQISSEIAYGTVVSVVFIPGEFSFDNENVKVTQNLDYCEFNHIPTTYNQILYIDTNTIGTQLDHIRCSDACYDIIYLPYVDADIQLTRRGTSLKVFTLTKELSMNIMQRIKTCCGENCTDIQIVPYCPDKPINKWTAVNEGGRNTLKCEIESIVETIPMYDQTSVSDFSGYVAAYQEGFSNSTGIAFWSSSCTNSRSIEYIYNDFSSIDSIKSSVEFSLSQNDNVKTSNQCNIVRLVSPNYNGQFEFSPSKINKVTKFNVDFMYMPYTPYIHVSPNFGGLYGEHNFNGKADATGLVCNGSFSIPQYDDKWADYCIQNKNYQNIFDREIKNMETNNTLNNVKNIVNMATDVGGGIVKGAMTGGNPASMAIGGVTGAIKGATGLATSILGQQEALDYKKDMYGMNLDNIKALPYSLSNVGVFNNNNKIFPFVEIYTCTTEEKVAFENKLKYNGMSVGRIGTISEFVNNVPNYSYIEYDEYNYIKGKLIRLLKTDEDNHFVNYLASELDKGAFFRRG